MASVEARAATASTENCSNGPIEGIEFRICQPGSAERYGQVQLIIDASRLDQEQRLSSLRFPIIGFVAYVFRTMNVMYGSTLAGRSTWSGSWPVSLVFTAPSVPSAADAAAGPPAEGGHRYSRQVAEAARLVAASVGLGEYDVVWQSRSGPPQVPWLAPDILDHLDALHAAGTPAVVVAPVGFVSDHVEVVWDLDTEARERAAELGDGLRPGGHGGPRPAVRGHGGRAGGPAPRRSPVEHDPERGLHAERRPVRAGLLRHPPPPPPRPRPRKGESPF